MSLVIALEPFASIAEEAEVLGAKHFEEVDGGIEPRRRYRLDRAAMYAASHLGVFICVSARRDGVLVGYLTWTIQRDPEASVLWADQGAWYVAEGGGNGKTALRLWRRSLAELRSRGVKIVTPHHRQQGRGAGLGKFFRRQGAVHVKSVYQLWIGD